MQNHPDKNKSRILPLIEMQTFSCHLNTVLRLTLSVIPGVIIWGNLKGQLFAKAFSKIWFRALPNYKFIQFKHSE